MFFPTNNGSITHCMELCVDIPHVWWMLGGQDCETEQQKVNQIVSTLYIYCTFLFHD